MNTKASLLRSLQAKLRQLTEDHDTTVVLSEEALAEARALLAGPPELPSDLEILTTVGSLHWFRCQALGPGSGERDLRCALFFLAPVYRADSGAVPPGVRRLFAKTPAEQLRPEQLIASAVQSTHRSTEAGSSGALDEAIDFFRQVIRALPDNHPDQARYLFALNHALEHRFELTSSIADIDQAVEVSQQAVAAILPQDPNYASALSNLGNVLRVRFGRMGDRINLDEAIEVGRSAKAESMHNHSTREQPICNWVRISTARFTQGHHRSDLDEAIDNYLLAATPGDGSLHMLALAGLAGALTARYERTGDAADLTEAVAAHRRAIGAAQTRSCSTSPYGVSDPAPGDEHHPPRYQRYARVMLKTRMEMWRRTGDPEWLGDARAHHDASALLDSALMEPWHAVAAVDAAQFLMARTIAVEGTTRSEGLVAFVSLLGFLHAFGIAADVNPPDPALVAGDRRTGPLPQLSELMRFTEQFHHTPTPLATGELALSRVSDYDQTFFTALDALIFMNELLEETDRVTHLTRLTEYLKFVKHQTSKYGTAHFYEELVWGQAMDDVEELSVGSDNRAEIDEKLDALRELIRQMPQDNPNRAARLSKLATVLRQRFQRSRRLEDLDDCIGRQREAVYATAATSTMRGDMMANLSLLHETRFETRTTDGEASASVRKDFDQAIEVMRSSLQHTPIDHAWRANRLGAQATMLLRRFEWTNAATDLDEAMASLEEAVGADGLDDGERERLWGILAWARRVKAPPADDVRLRRPRASLHELMERVTHSTDGQGIGLLQTDQACDELLAALANFVQPSNLKSDLQLLADTVNFLHFRSLQMNSADSVHEKSISHIVEHELERLQTATVDELAVALPQVACDALARLRDLWRRPAPVPASDRLDQYRDLLEELGETWPPTTLDEKISRLSEIMQDPQLSSAYVGFLHAELGIALWERFQREGSHADIGGSLEHFSRYGDFLDPNDLNYAHELGGNMLNIGTAALTLVDTTHDVDMLSNAVKMLRRALKLFPQGSNQRVIGLSNLGMALGLRYSLTKTPSDVWEALTALREALQGVSDVDPDRPGIMTNLSMTLCSSYELTLDPKELQDAIETGQSALATLPLDSRHRARLLANVGVCFKKQFRHTGCAQARTQAINYFEQAARSEASPAWDRIRPARGWGLLAADAEEYSNASDGLGYVVELLPSLAWHGLSLVNRLSYLGSDGLAGLPSEAAACAISDGSPDRAIQLLEHGRGILLSQVLNLRTDLSALATKHPDLAQELDTVRSRLDGAEDTDQGSRRDLAVRWDRLLNHVRSMPGFSRFLLPPRVDTLRSAAEAGPVVVLNVSTRRCDALLLQEKGVRLKELPELTAKAVSEEVTRYLSVLGEAERTAAECFSAREMACDQGTPEATRQYVEAQRARAEAQQAMEHTLCEIMAWLWETIAEPVLTALGIGGPPAPNRPWPRVWWCPTGALRLLPLHVAAHPDADGRRNHRAVLDRTISSYTPTLRALIQARQHLADVGAADRILVAALPETPGLPHLPNVNREKELLAALFPGHRHTLLESEQATRSKVSQALPDHRWAHLSCHGDQNLSQPLQGGLLLYDGMLTFNDVIGQRHYGEFAFLSACKTATDGINFADEIVTVAGALHYTGYRHVIACSWSILGSKAADLAEAVYADLSSDGTFSPGRAAEALHNGIRMLRDRYPSHPSVWMPFTHTGP